MPFWGLHSHYERKRSSARKKKEKGSQKKGFGASPKMEDHREKL